MPHRSHLTVIDEYFAEKGSLIAAERVWLELKYMTTFGVDRPLGIAEMIAQLRGKKGGKSGDAFQ